MRCPYCGTPLPAITAARPPLVRRMAQAEIAPHRAAKCATPHATHRYPNRKARP